MSPRVSAPQREALYQHILDRLSGIEDVWLAARSGQHEAATRLGGEYADYLRLVVDDLAFGAGSGEAIELTAPPDVLRRAFGRLRESAASQRHMEQAEWAEARGYEERNRLVTEACAAVLGELVG